MKVISKSGSKASKNGKNNGNKSKTKQSNSKQTECSNNDDEEKEDTSILRQSMDISVKGVSDLIKSVSEGTREFKEIALNECNLIYECKVCRNLFRSIANFISHKRAYCKQCYNYYSHGFPQSESQTVIVQPDVIVKPVECQTSKDNVETDWVTSDKVPQQSEDTSSSSKQEIISQPSTKITSKKDIAKVVNNLVSCAANKDSGKADVNANKQTEQVRFYSDVAERVAVRRNNLREQTVKLENNDKSNNSVFQTIVANNKSNDSLSIKTEVMELENMSRAAVLKENGNFLLTSDVVRQSKFTCSYCKSKFITRKTLTKHIKIHHWERTCYPCPLCKVYFATPWAVYRHLGKVHHRTEEQIRRLRCQVLTKAIKQRLLHAPPKLKSNCVDNLVIDTKETEKWMNSFEGELRCHGCGKLFNRRAALNVHNSMCKVVKVSKPTVKQDKQLELREESPSQLTTVSPQPLPSPSLQILQSRIPKIIPPVYQSGKISIQIRRDYNKDSSGASKLVQRLASPAPCAVCKYVTCTCKKLENVVRKLYQNAEKQVTVVDSAEQGKKTECSVSSTPTKQVTEASVSVTKELTPPVECNTNLELDISVPNFDISSFLQVIDSFCFDLTSYVPKWKYPGEDIDDPFFGFTGDDFFETYEPMALSLLEAEQQLLNESLCIDDRNYNAPLSPVYSDIPSDVDGIDDVCVGDNVEVNNDKLEAGDVFVVENGYDVVHSDELSNIDNSNELSDSENEEVNRITSRGYNHQPQQLQVLSQHDDSLRDHCYLKQNETSVKQNKLMNNSRAKSVKKAVNHLNLTTRNGFVRKTRWRVNS